MRPLLFAALATTCAVACTKNKPAASTTPVAQGPSRPATPSKVEPASPSVGVEDELTRRCALRLGRVEQAPKFSYDGFQLEPEDRNLLEQVATCFTTGPLAGRTLALVGRADPRGTEEYNLGLGDRRAHSVSDYLQRLGVAPTQLASTTRGALDANGADEDGWRTDRRVDLQLVQ
ncbi:MAG: OmpA family protein [Kofleriaceae bacterium]